jgi:hypothetical protein
MRLMLQAVLWMTILFSASGCVFSQNMWGTATRQPKQSDFHLLEGDEGWVLRASGRKTNFGRRWYYDIPFDAEAGTAGLLLHFGVARQ